MRGAPAPHFRARPPVCFRGCYAAVRHAAVRHEAVRHAAVRHEAVRHEGRGPAAPTRKLRRQEAAFAGSYAGRKLRSQNAAGCTYKCHCRQAPGPPSPARGRSRRLAGRSDPRRPPPDKGRAAFGSPWRRGAAGPSASGVPGAIPAGQAERESVSTRTTNCGMDFGMGRVW
jgi:hypothetical protein